MGRKDLYSGVGGCILPQKGKGMGKGVEGGDGRCRVRSLDLGPRNRG